MIKTYEKKYEEAAAGATLKPVHVLIVDFQMPYLNGLHVVNKVKARIEHFN
jgi:YesN/AraC family two-component response regulator